MREYELLSKLFEYPDSSYKQSIVDIADNIKEKYPLASKELMELHSKLPNDIYKLQELYTKSFEVQAITSLEIGYVLYGDDYTRGEILANLSAEQKRVGNSCDMELPDHLSNILRLISRLEDRELLDDLITLMVAPAVENMIKEFTPSKDSNVGGVALFTP